MSTRRFAVSDRRATPRHYVGYRRRGCQSDEEAAAALDAGAATDIGVVKRFVCPVIKVPRA
jgi:hypothetical protein